MTQIPSKQQIMDWVADHPDANSKRDIAKAFGIKGAQRIELKRLLKELEAEGQLERRRRHYMDAEKLPPVTVLELLAPDGSGDLFARPLEWRGEGPMPKILYTPRQTDPALGRGERFLARLVEVHGETGNDPHLMRRRLERNRLHEASGIPKREDPVPDLGRLLPHRRTAPYRSGRASVEPHRTHDHGDARRLLLEL